MASVAIGTFLHAFNLFAHNFESYQEMQLVKSLSIIENTRQLFLNNNRGSRNLSIDLFKFFTVFFGTMGHALCCLEIPISYFVIGMKCPSM